MSITSTKSKKIDKILLLNKSEFREEMKVKIRKELKWKPKISFNKGIQDTINWYRNSNLEI